MVKVYEINGVRPVVHPTAYVHPSAVLIGDVIVGPRCYIGPLASMRGDFGRLILEEGANLQDTCVLHGCRIKRNAMVGMNAVVMDKAVVGEESIVAAMSFVKAGMIIPPRSMVMGTPAKVMRELTDEDVKWKSFGTRQYHELNVRSLETMREVEAFTEVEPNRKGIDFGTETLHKPKS